MKPKVLIDVPPIHKDVFEAFRRGPDVDLIHYDSSRPLSDRMKDVTAVLAGLSSFDEAIITNSPLLKIVAKHGVGYDNIHVPAATQRKIPVAVTPYANNLSVAEYTAACMLTMTKKLYPSNCALKDGTYRGMKDFTSIDIWQKTIGIVGLGKIGSEVARMCRTAFNMTVLAYDPYVTEAYAGNTGARLVSDLDELLGLADILTVHTPLTPETRKMISKDQFKKMKSTAYVINSARGDIVDEQALVEALDAGLIQGAAVDATVQEPPSLDHPMVRHEKILVTPHIAANTDEAMSRMAVMAAEEIIRVLRGERPWNIVNPEIYM